MKSHGFILIVTTLEPVFACIVNVPFIYNSRQSGLWDHLTNKYNIHYERHLGILESEPRFYTTFNCYSKIWTDKAVHTADKSRDTSVPSLGRDVVTTVPAASIIESRVRTSPCHASHCVTRTASVM